jgi:integrase
MSTLAQAVEDYLTIRRALGFKLEEGERLLFAFARFVEQAGSDVATTDLAVRWATLPADASSYWWALRLGRVRPFIEYLHGLDPRHEVPPRELLKQRHSRAQPHLYADVEIQALLAECSRFQGRLMQSTYATLFGLLYVTGMRVGEAIALGRSDLDPSNQVLTIRHGKFDKSRELVLHESTVQALVRYAELRDLVMPRPKDATFFVSSSGTALIYKNVQFNFSRLRRWTGLDACAPVPRIHDLRHSFAVTTLMRWYQQGLDVQVRLPRLSTYLGHVSPSSTYWYLSAVPELLSAAAARLDDKYGDPP